MYFGIFKYIGRFSEDLEKEGLKTVPSKSLEEMYDEMKDDLPQDYENIRGPRPWEDNSEWEAVKQKRQQELQSKREQQKAVSWYLVVIFQENFCNKSILW